MRIIKRVNEMQRWSMEQRLSGHIVGLVPTMGCLHEGHLSLIELAKQECDTVVVSIFVNPSQFGPDEDFERYPRNKENDISICEKYGVSAVFVPDADEMYAADTSVCVEEKSLSVGLCGASRPGHFTGVCTVVAKLFNIVFPNQAVFGQKDYQQAAVIQRMIRDLNFPVELRIAPVVREKNGIAMSSRNTYLSESDRKRASAISAALEIAQEKYFAGEADAAALSNLITDKLLDAGLNIDYVQIVDGYNLNPVETVNMGDVALVAVYCGDTRLIDNCIF
ncbi:MAG: pantoate--beta-alanine ligase [Kiritimatiellia bacterium]